MATTYCTPEDVATICGLTDHEGERAVFDENISVPSREEVLSLINDAEELIEDRCGNAWGDRSIQIEDELHDFFCDTKECSIHLNVPNVVAFDDQEGDKLEVWYGNDWIDWVLTKTEGRGDDFFVDYKLGKIWFLRNRPRIGSRVMKITYRYNGGTNVPRAIKISTAMQVGVLLSNSEQVDIRFPEGASSDFTTSDMITRWEKYIDKSLKVYEISAVPVGLDFTPINI